MRRMANLYLNPTVRNVIIPLKLVIGPALKGITERITDKKLLREWIRNNQKVLATGDKYFTNLFEQYGKTPMNTFPRFERSKLMLSLNM